MGKSKSSYQKLKEENERLKYVNKKFEDNIGCLLRLNTLVWMCDKDPKNVDFNGIYNILK